MKLGIDFGTTNSALAYYDGNQLEFVKADAKNANPYILPSLIYFHRDGQFTVGTEAAEHYLQNESNRSVRWESKPIGQVLIIEAGRGSSLIQYWQPLSILVDEAATGRLFQSSKTYLRHLLMDGTQVFDRYLTIDQLLATLLLNLRHRAEAQFQQPCEDVVIGRPVNFSHDPKVDQKAEEILYKAAYLAGFKQISFALEPIGALFLYHINEVQRSKVLTFDFGGGTLDLTVAEVGGELTPNILATRGVLIGGDDLDRKIMQMLLKHFAADERANQFTIPYDMVEQLQSWQTMPELSKPHFQEEINTLFERARHLKNGEAIRQLNSLNTLVKSAMGYSLFRKIEETKKRLSNFILAPLSFEHEDLKISQVIQRQVFENRMRKEIAEIKEAIEDVVSDAGISISDVDFVVRTGGTSQTPMFIDLLSSLFGKEKLRDIDPLTSVVGGLAIIAHQSGGKVPDYATKYFHKPDDIISNISVSSKSLYESFIIQAGETAYSDLDSIWVDKLSIQLSALPAIRTANADRNNADGAFLKFSLAYPSKVYIAYSDTQAGIPDWLKTFSRASYFLEIKDNLDRVTKMLVYVKEFEAGEVILGGNNASEFEGVYHHYLVIVENLS